MNFTILHMGEGKEAYYKEAVDEFCKRMRAFGSLNLIPLKPAKTAGRELSEDEIALALEKEAEDWDKLLQSQKFSKSYKIALCIEGGQVSSEGLAELFQKAANSGKSSVVFLIGSSWGIADRIKKICDLRLSFSKMTFPHQLFRVLLLEQIYRGFQIAVGSKYHK